MAAPSSASQSTFGQLFRLLLVLPYALNLLLKTEANRTPSHPSDRRPSHGTTTASVRGSTSATPRPEACASSACGSTCLNRVGGADAVAQHEIKYQVRRFQTKLAALLRAQAECSREALAV